MSEASKIIQTKVNNEFNRQVDDLAKEVTDKIDTARERFKGYSTRSDTYLVKAEFLKIFDEHASSSQYNSPLTLKLNTLIKALITKDVEESGKEIIAKSLVAKIERFFEEGDEIN